MIVVLQHAGKWLHFRDPVRVLRAERVDEVMTMLREAEQSGFFAAGFVAYEAAPAFDPALQTKPADGFPLLCLGLFHAPTVLDELERSGAFELGPIVPSLSPADFSDAIGRIKEQIAAGATYQVNYTYRLHAPFSGDAWAFFHDLVAGQRAERAAFVDVGDFALCSASPELFFERKQGVITARPMKGTARRGRTFAEDFGQAEALRHSAKDRAENVMIVDMLRNDIGRIAVPGSVETASLFDVEKYPTVWQMTSTVRGQIGAQSLSSVFEALFPCASITGAPKAQTMAIITELETSPRRIYTGAIGFAAPDGEACFNVAIRTALIQGGTLEFGVGGGIVWDSDAAAEYEETLTKARVLTQPRPEFRLLETMLWEPEGGIFLLDAHLQRLGKSAAYFDIPLDVFAIVHALDQRCGEWTAPQRIRLLVDRAGAFEIENSACLPPSAGPMRAALAKQPVDSHDLFLFHKTTHRTVYETARAGFPACDEVILWNENNEVTEGTFTNVVVRKNGRLVTPPVACGLLAGTFRARLLASGEIAEETVLVADLLAADEVFLVNSVRRWQKAVVQPTEA